jgi:hypothetical protein
MIFQNDFISNSKRTILISILVSLVMAGTGICNVVTKGKRLSRVPPVKMIRRAMFAPPPLCTEDKVFNYVSEKEGLLTWAQ